MIDLNNETYDSTEISIFNGGKSGIAENITMSISKKKPEDAEKSPDYKITFTDSTGSTCNSSFWYITEPTQYKTVEQLGIAQGKMMKHILHVVYGADFKIPPFADQNAVLDGCMDLIRKGINTDTKVRIFTNYGTTSSVKKFLQPRSWVPFMESMTTPITETKLKAGDLDAMEKLNEDSLVGGYTSASPNANPLGDNEEW